MASSDAALGSAARPLSELPDIEQFFTDAATVGISDDFAELFTQEESLLRSGSSRVVVFRNADIRAIATHPAAGNMPAGLNVKRAYLASSASNAVADEDRAHMARISGNQIFTSNAPLHGPTRQFFARPLMPKFMPEFAAIADRIVPHLIDEVAGLGEIDLSFQFTEKLTARFWGEVFGMTPAESERMVDVVRAMTPYFFLERLPEEIPDTNRAAGEYMKIISESIHRTLRAGTHPMLNAMALEFDAIALEGKPESLGVSLAANLVDGFHTAALGATNTVYQLLKNPDALAAVKDDPALVPNALAEGLRLSPPVIVTHRYALEAFDYNDVRIPAGMAIAMLWAAGNRDPAVYDEPNDYRLMRQQRLSTTFGGGIHICPGRNVARVLVDSVLRGLTAPGVHIELTGDIKWMPRSTMRQSYRMPVAIRRG